MKTKLLPIEKSIFAFFIIITIFSCKKEGITSVLTAVEKSAATGSTAFQTDGILTVEESILPPATTETFIANGKSSKEVFQILSSQVVTIENAYFFGTYPLIQYLTTKISGLP